MPQNIVKDSANSGAAVGIIGLAVMGSNFARNLAGKGVKTAVYNRTPEVTEQFLANHGNEQIIGSTTLDQFVASLATPRKIILLVKAGEAVDAVIESLIPLLDKEDMIIDFGNSHFSDTERRADQLKSKNIHFWGCGISGGELGALSGPSLMPGGPKQVWPELQPILEAAAARDFGGKPCVAYLGHGSAGNYVKMVHNGIEYAIMQMMAEAYELLGELLNMTAPEIADIFKTYDRGKLSGFLLELGATVLKRKDEESPDYLINKIMDKASQKGTGSWTAMDGLERGIAIPTITEAVISRIISSRKDRRQTLEKIYDRPLLEERPGKEAFIDCVENALYAGAIATFAQGFELIQQASEENGWDTNLAEVARIWQGGCIIRMVLLNILEKELRANGNRNLHLFQLPGITPLLKENITGLQRVVETAARNQIPCPALSSAFNYFLASTQGRGNAHFIQALRDAFGAHTYERIDREGSFHTEWHE